MTPNKKKMLKYNYSCSIMSSTDLSTNNCAPNFIQNTDILITPGNTSAENKALEWYNLTITSKVGSNKPCFFLYQL